MTVTDRDENQSATELPRPARPSGPLKRRAPTGPAARFDPGRVAEPRHRNPAWLLAGVLLVLLSALGGVLLFSSNDDRTEVLVAATDLEPGRPITATDLRIERVAVDGGVASVDPSAADRLAGQMPIGRVPAGTMLSPGMFADEVPLGAGEMVFGAALDPGEAPLSGLQVGSPVELLTVAIVDPAARAAVDPAAPQAVPESAATPIGTGSVWAVEPIATGQLWVSLRVPRDVGFAASLASAEDILRVVLVGGGQ
jgi:hypothetical protein